MTIQKHETSSAGGVSQNTQQDTDSRIFAQFVPDRKTFESVLARFLLRGYVLTVSRRADDSRHTWAVSKWNGSRHLCHWGDVVALLSQMEEAR